MAISRLCSIPDCGKPARRRGWCRSHYLRNLRHGSPLGGQTPRGAPFAFIKTTAAICMADDCLQWPFSRGRTGYATINYKRKATLAHRIVCIIAHGEPPTAEHQAAHRCGGGRLGCVNASHLYWATPKENSADTISHGTHNRGENCGMSKLTGYKVAEIRAFLASGARPKEIAKKFGVSDRTIRHIRDGDRWSYSGAS